ncbi:alpha/beta hydrolase [Rhodococcus sp. ABRD24]|uniref:alpha/beta hydrolase n=1 Tax=Rhodococcus sp. ABRD24 TaxID=2507582 RepID=UPI00103BA659|nr:alpha/beta hydrolase [Rhodococcus sp. ABRD24]QBJ96491.1 alpha/beta hydrolase [Rhodococcus sp. ABRD24]
MTTPLYRQFRTQAELDAEYDIEATVPDFSLYAGDFVQRSERVRSEGRVLLDIRYGSDIDANYDVFLPPSSFEGPRPTLYFVHGGYWKATTSKVWSYIAEGLCSRGFVVVVENYALCPRVTIDDIVQQHREGFAHFWNHLDDYGADGDRIVLAGHSAGGHGVAALLQTDWAADYGLPAIPYAGAIGVSGVYDLRPLPHSFLGPLLQLDPDTAARLSPELDPPVRLPAVAFAYGSQEPSEFQRQTVDFAATLAARSGQSFEVLEIEANHFDILDQLANPNGVLAEIVARFAGVESVVEQSN